MEQFPDINSIGNNSNIQKPLTPNTGAPENIEGSVFNGANEQVSAVNNADALLEASQMQALVDEQMAKETELNNAYNNLYSGNAILKLNFTSSQDLRQGVDNVYNSNINSLKNEYKLDTPEQWLNAWMSGKDVPEPNDPRFFAPLGNNMFAGANGQSYTFDNGKLININKQQAQAQPTTDNGGQGTYSDSVEETAQNPQPMTFEPQTPKSGGSDVPPIAPEPISVEPGPVLMYAPPPVDPPTTETPENPDDEIGPPKPPPENPDDEIGPPKPPPENPDDEIGAPMPPPENPNDEIIAPQYEEEQEG